MYNSNDINGCVGCGPLPPLPDCGSCGNCAGCVEPEIIHVRRNKFLDTCDYVVATIKEFVIKNANVGISCTLKFGTPIIVNNTVLLTAADYNGAVEYSRDGVLFQDSNFFGSLECGSHRFFIRQKNSIACIVSGYVDITYNCACIPNWTNTENPPLTDCINNVLHYRQSDGCGNVEWRASSPAQTCGCVPNWQPTTSPPTPECIDGFIHHRYSDGCGKFEWRRQSTTCDPANQCVTPGSAFAVSTQAATCNQQGQLLDNAVAVLTLITNADRYGIWPGATYQGPAYEEATPFTGQTLTINNLKGYQYDNSYVLRLYNKGNNCYLDKPINIIGTSCDPACQLPAYAFSKVDPTCTANVAANNGKLVLSNFASSTRWQLCEGATFTCPVNYNAATPISGGAAVDIATNIGFGLNQQYRDFTVRVYNGNASCFTDSTLRFSNPCFNAPSCIQPTVNNHSATQAGCSGATPLSNATIALTGINNGNRYGFSVGQTYSGSGYDNAIPFSGSSFTIAGLPGSQNDTNYVIRVFNGKNDCYVDIQETVPGVTCNVPCFEPTANTPVATAATCTGPTVNNDARIDITGIVNGGKYGYSAGISYSGPAFDNATMVVGGVISIANLVGSANQTTYTIRIFNNSNTCYEDFTVNVPGKTCNTPCVNPTFSIAATAPVGCTGEVSAQNGKVTISNIVNGTRWQICLDTTFTCTENYAGATPFSGSGPIDVFTTAGFFAGEESRPFTVRVYNGSATCYTDHSVVMNNPCMSCCNMTIDSIELTNI